MGKEEKILILGARGLVGSALVRAHKAKGINNLLTPSSQDLNLRKQEAVLNYFNQNKPNQIYMAAAKVGGIHANNTYRADFILENLQIECNVFEAALQSNVEKLLFFGSSCIYPKHAPQPIKEEYLLSSPLEETNEPYAIAKIAGLKMAENIRRQYGKNFFSIMPTNLYGEGDNFHPENSHVIPGLIHRMDSSIKKGEKEFKVWGTGNPRREFLYVDDLAEAALFLMDKKETMPYFVNVGTGNDISIKELVETLAGLMNYKGQIYFDPSYPDGTMLKRLDTTLIQSLGWHPKTSLVEGLKKTIEFYRQGKNIRT